MLRVSEVLKGPEVQVIRDGLGHIEGDAVEQDILYVKPPAGSYRGKYGPPIMWPAVTQPGCWLT